jgi:hypothetical protein
MILKLLSGPEMMSQLEVVRASPKPDYSHCSTHNEVWVFIVLHTMECCMTLVRATWQGQIHNI